MYFQIPSASLSGNAVPSALMASEEGRLSPSHMLSPLPVHLLLFFSFLSKSGWKSQLSKELPAILIGHIVHFLAFLSLEGFSLLMVYLSEQINVCAERLSLWQCHHLGATGGSVSST